MGESVLYLNSSGGVDALVVDGVEIPNVDPETVIHVDFEGHSFPRVTVTLVAPSLDVISAPSGEAEVSRPVVSSDGGDAK